MGLLQGPETAAKTGNLALRLLARKHHGREELENHLTHQVHGSPGRTVENTVELRSSSGKNCQLKWEIDHVGLDGPRL